MNSDAIALTINTLISHKHLAESREKHAGQGFVWESGCGLNAPAR